MYDPLAEPVPSGTEIIDLRSDTVTHPTPAMREAMATAEVGDEQYGEDPTVHRLEQMMADLLGKESAVYVASGTMGNLTSLLAHTQRGDEFILGDESHIRHYESAAPATLGSISPRSIHNHADGTFDLDELQDAIRTTGYGFPPTALICMENTHNRCSGAVIPLEHMRAVHDIARDHGLPLHLDGARIFNAANALGVPARDIAATVDSVQVCLSKGLAAPVGSLIAGDAGFIQKARRYRKMLGGAMRQSGVIAAAGIVALETMIDRLGEDHIRAKSLAHRLDDIDLLSVNADAVQSNIIICKPVGIDQSTFINAARHEGVLLSDFGSRGIRLVTHYEITDDKVDRAVEILHAVAKAIHEGSYAVA